MLLLAVDTSGKNGSLALARVNDPAQTKEGLERGTRYFEVLELVPLAGRMYSAQMIPELQNALSRQNLRKSDIDAYVVASGPGSFTGLRVGLSTVKALSEVLHKPIAAVSVLQAAAHMCADSDSVTVALEAGRQQVFVGECFLGDCFFGPSAPRESLLGYDEFFAMIKGREQPAYSPDLPFRQAAAERGIVVLESVHPRADTFALIGLRKLIAGETTPAETLEANYIRASDAELFSLPKLMP